MKDTTPTCILCKSEYSMLHGDENRKFPFHCLTCALKRSAGMKLLDKCKSPTNISTEICVDFINFEAYSRYTGLQLSNKTRFAMKCKQCTCEYKTKIVYETKKKLCYM